MTHSKLLKAAGYVILVVLICAGIAGAVEQTRKYINKRIDRMMAERNVARPAPVAPAPAPPPARIDQSDLQHLNARLTALESLSVGAASSLSNRAPLASEYRGQSAPVFAMLDAVGPYRKNGLFEAYGGNFRERRSGPIRVTEADFEITHGEAWLIWSPDFSPARDATHLQVEFAEAPTKGKLKVGVILNDGQALAWGLNFPDQSPTPAGLLPPVVPEDIIGRANSAQVIENLQLASNKATIALPPSVLLLLRSGQSKAISQWFVKVEEAAGTTMRFRTLALVRPAPPATSAGVALSGKVTGEDLAPNTSIELLDESGAARNQLLAADGHFAFDGVDPAKIVSLRLRHQEFVHGATLGRWFVPGYGRSDLVVDMRPIYVNEDGHAPDQSRAKFIGARTPSPVAAFYEPHSRQHWTGAGTIQEYDSTTFANNQGYIDRDRFFDNPDNCVRLASTGGSDMVALQVRPFEKYNILLEESLGIALKKCVEVISAATDNGDIGTNYPRIRDYTSKLGVRGTLVSMLAGLVSQVSPTMLRDGLGLDPENSPIPNFFHDQRGALTFRTASPVYAVFSVKPTLPDYEKGIPFGQTLSVPFDSMPKPGKEAFEYWTEIVAFIEKNHPGQNFIFHTGVDQAQCRKNCEATLTLAEDKTVQAGAKGFVRNVTEYCAKHGFTCLHPAFSDRYGEVPRLLTFQYDGHYSKLGHQWLAQELTMPLAATLSGTAK